jgi:hypothetical protein
LELLGICERNEQTYESKQFPSLFLGVKYSEERGTEKAQKMNLIKAIVEFWLTHFFSFEFIEPQ